MTYQVRYLKPIKTQNLELEQQKLLILECGIFQDLGKQLRFKPAVRLPDWEWETGFPLLLSEYPEIQFFGFTNNLERMLKHLKGKFPYNYHLTFRSKSEAACLKVLKETGNVAKIFKEVPSKKWGYQVHKVEHPFRFLDPWGVIALQSRGTKCG